MDKFNFGDHVAILVYDEEENPVDYEIYILLMSNENYSLLSPIVNGQYNPVELCEGYYESYMLDDEISYCGDCIIVPNSKVLTREEARKSL